mmetsp:Transcript_17121/g.55003  ORF Transcript_17121/g.55003 Transcript_17121/m.55003 type:complete len:264 (-) Transcript_17121:702-1493(-)
MSSSTPRPRRLKSLVDMMSRRPVSVSHDMLPVLTLRLVPSMPHESEPLVISSASGSRARRAYTATGRSPWSVALSIMRRSHTYESLRLLGMVPTWYSWPVGVTEDQLRLPMSDCTMNLSYGKSWAMKWSSSSLVQMVYTPCPALLVGTLTTALPPNMLTYSGTSALDTSCRVSGVRMRTPVPLASSSALNRSYALDATSLLRPPARHASVGFSTSVLDDSGMRVHGRCVTYRNAARTGFHSPSSVRTCSTPSTQRADASVSPA